MAETAGLVIGAVSLASIFADCADCFNYIRIAQALEDDFPIYQTELDVLQLRFSRWAQAVAELSSARSPAVTEDVAPLVEKILKQIARLFQRAREDAEDCVDAAGLNQFHLDPDQNATLAKVHSKLKAIIVRRQKTPKTAGIRKKAQWALYKKDEFVTLIVNLRNKMDDLERVIPVAELRERLERMQMEDAREVQSDTDEEMKLVEDSAKDVDPRFGQAVAQTRCGHSFSKTEIGDHSAVQMGDSMVAGYSGPLSQAYNTYHDTKIGKNAQVSMGTLYGRTVFDTPLR